MNYQPQLKKQYQSALAVSFAFIFSIMCYGLVVFLVKTNGDQLLQTGSNGILWLRIFLFVLAAAAVFSISRIRGIVLSGECKFSTAETPAESLTRRLLMATVISMALAEIPACMGLVLFFISSDLKDYYLFAALAMSAMIIYLPKYDQWEVWLKRRLPAKTD